MSKFKEFRYKIRQNPNMYLIKGLINAMYGFGFISLTILTFVIFSDLIAQLQLLTANGEHIRFHQPTDWVLSFFLKREPDGTYPVHGAEAALKIILDSAVCLITFFVVIHPIIARRKVEADVRKKQSIKLIRVYTRGTDDIGLMHKYYKNADSVIVYSGDFSWLQSETPLKKIVEELANNQKIKLVSSKNKDIVKHNIGDNLFEQLTQSNLIKYIDDKEIKCSLIVKGGVSTLLYLTKDEYSDVEDVMYMCIVTGRNESRFLLNAMELLMTKVWMHPPN